jgi:hypothetical protein
MNIFSKLLLFIAVISFLASCKKDDDSNPSVVGSWELIDIHSDNGVASTTVLGLPVTYTFKLQGSNYNTVTVFTDNPNEFTSTGSYTVTTTLYALGDTTTYMTEVPADPTTGEWSINGDIMTQILAGDTTEFTILELSDAKLRLRLDEDDTFVDNGTVVHEQATIFSTFERQ